MPSAITGVISRPRVLPGIVHIHFGASRATFPVWMLSSELNRLPLKWPSYVGHVPGSGRAMRSRHSRAQFAFRRPCRPQGAEEGN